jgi:glyoxylase-like metal-dependent hydrolase (beta-lactamase superfamily II)
VGDHLPEERGGQNDIAAERRQVPPSPVPPHAPERTGRPLRCGFVSERLYFRQLLSGRDFAESDPIAGSMVNFVYAIGDRDTGEAVFVDPAYDIQALLDIVAEDEMSVTGVLATHYHPDHVGGSMMGLTIQGVRELLDLTEIPVHVQREEGEWIKRVAELSDSELVTHDSGDIVRVGDIDIQLIHTPGHTPGSQCFLVDGRLVAGDTLFLEGCGRTDLPGADAGLMYESLTRLASLPDDVVLFPGHRYSLASAATLGSVKESNYVFKPKTKDQWLTMFGAA